MGRKIRDSIKILKGAPIKQIAVFSTETTEPEDNSAERI